MALCAFSAPLVRPVHLLSHPKCMYFSHHQIEATELYLDEESSTTGRDRNSDAVRKFQNMQHRGSKGRVRHRLVNRKSGSSSPGGPRPRFPITSSTRIMRSGTRSARASGTCRQRTSRPCAMIGISLMHMAQHGWCWMGDGWTGSSIWRVALCEGDVWLWRQDQRLDYKQWLWCQRQRVPYLFACWHDSSSNTNGSVSRSV